MAAIIFEPDRRAADFSFLNIGEVSVLSITHKQSSTLSKYPIESGGTISDHLQREPDELNIRCVLGDLVSLREFSSEKTTSAWCELDKLHNEGSLINLATDVKSYENMVITELTAPRNGQMGRSLVFNMRLQHVRMSELLTTQFVDGGEGDTDNPSVDRPPEDSDTGDRGFYLDGPDYPDPPTDNGGNGGIGSGDRGDFGRDERDELLRYKKWLLTIMALKIGLAV